MPIRFTQEMGVMKVLKKVLCAHEKYYLFQEKYGLSACNHYIYHSVKSSGLVENVSFFPYDQLVQLGIEGMSEILWEECVKFSPEAIIFYAPWQGYWKQLVHVLEKLRHEGVKVITFYSDLTTALVNRERFDLFKGYSHVADCLLNIDSVCLPVMYDHPCHIRGYTGIDPNIFFWNPLPKDIDVSFLGSRAQSYSSRREYISFLEQNFTGRNINFLVGGGQLPEEKSLSRNDYVNLLSRSKITLNFSRTLGDVRQIKGRIFEAMACRTFILDEENPNTRKLFIERSDFCSYDSKEELLEKILYYLEHEEEREIIACSGWKKVKELWNTRNLWGYVFEKLGFDISEIEDDFYKKYRKLMDKIQSENR